MYSLLMHGNDEKWDSGTADIERGRFLEHTDEAIAQRFKSLDDKIITELKSYPVLFAYEIPQDRAARLGWISHIARHETLLKFKFHFDNRFDPIEPELLAKLLGNLDISSKFEVYRSHWALKDVNLIEVMTTAGLLISARKKPPTEYRFSRQTILRASTMHKKLSHTDFDAFVLELGVDDIKAGRDRGSRQSRAISLGEYAVNHPDEMTASGGSLAYEIVLSAARMDAQYPEGLLYDVDDATRRQFWESLARDGYALSDGFFMPLTELPKQNPRGESVSTPATPTAPTRTDRAMATGSKPKIFIVHGRDDATKNDVARFIAQLELDAVILHEQTNRGRTLTTKFVEVASEATFAVVLITPDDVGGLSKDALRPRARQNVIFELGYFIGLLGPEKVCALVAGTVERPSDFEAVVYVPYGANTGWRADLARELRGAGIKFDPGKVF
jgi:hypothetical protein